ncbi:MAG TPA: hypothetical protein PLQ95_11530 [Thiobacillus sp.]|nr:hypothetical protein [Thiobacillus sp.]
MPVAAPIGQKIVISSGNLGRIRIHPGLTKKSAADGNVTASSRSMRCGNTSLLSGQTQPRDVQVDPPAHAD